MASLIRIIDQRRSDWDRVTVLNLIQNGCQVPLPSDQIDDLFTNVGDSVCNAF
jgi:hypothetical protein